jgi:glycosyltransferase involved in cell wall biosynthesis
VTQVLAIFGSYAPSLIAFRGDLIADAVALGHKVHALAPDIDEATANKLRELGAEPVAVPLGRTSLNPFDAMRSARALRSTLKGIRPDVLIAYTIKPVILGARAARGVGVPRFVPMITGLGYAFLGERSIKRRIIRETARFLYRRALREAHVRDFERMGILAPSAPTLIVNGSGIDLDRFPQQPLVDRPHFLMISRLLRDKGIREFAAASARIKRERPEVEISLVGWRDESPDSISQHELDAITASGVTYLGKLDDVRPALAACSIYVLPSYREGTPRSVLEAMAVGRAIITTDAPGCRETVVDGENGILVPARDADALYDAMLRLAVDAGLRSRMAESSRRLAEAKYDVRQVNRAILDAAGL